MPHQQQRPTFGWDLAGYGNSGSGLCRADRSGNAITATVLRATFVCKPKLKMESAIGKTAMIEREMLRLITQVGAVYIDVPIDLQDLPRVVDFQSHATADRYWQLVKRPIDHAFDALEPLGSNLGYAVARIARLLGNLAATGSAVDLDRNIFETYPAASLRLIAGANDSGDVAYKAGQIAWTGERWRPRNIAKNPSEETLRRSSAFAELAGALRLRADEGVALNDDEFDAVLCAVTGCIPESAVKDDDLETLMRARLAQRGVPESIVRGAVPPKGYVLLRGIPANLQITVRTVTCRTPSDLYAAITAPTVAGDDS